MNNYDSSAFLLEIKISINQRLYDLKLISEQMYIQARDELMKRSA